MKKLFVIDTNVVLFDHTCIYNFQEHDVALSAVVLEELDRFKRGNDLINLEARQFIRELDALCSTPARSRTACRSARAVAGSSSRRASRARRA